MTDSATKARLRRLGDGVAIDEICSADALTRADFERWWAAECDRRLPRTDGSAGLPVQREAQVLRDARGIPHVFAETDHDLFVAYGFAMAQDRLFQMDLRRRRGAGRLAEALGNGGLEADILARTMDMPRLAAAEYARLPDETRGLFDAFALGVNAAIDEATEQDALPIEFDLLGYAPEPWTGLDCVRCVVSWRWQLTGRPWVISMPELVKRTLGDEALYQAFLAAQRTEADDGAIVPDGEGTARDIGLLDLASVLMPLETGAGGSGNAGSTSRIPVEAGPSAFAPASPPDPGFTAGTVESMGGSNNWVVAGSRSRSGKPILASDPHMPYEAASSFYEAHLSGGSFDCVGAGFVGYPGLTFGRNRHLAWGITNNICSQRDLYLERDPGAVVETRDESIVVRGRSEPVAITVQVTDRGPIVDRLLPATANPSGPVSLRWVGQLACDWPSAQMRLSRAGDVDEAFNAIRGWLAPTFSLLVADDSDPSGHIAFTSTGAIPVRGRTERGYRDAADPADAWQGLIPPEGMPQVRDPARGWLGSANNRPAADEFPYPLSGTWDEGLRHRRIGVLAERLTPHDAGTFARMQADVRPGRATDRRPAALAALAGRVDVVEQAALEVMTDWDGWASPDSAGAAIWEVFWMRWVQAVAAVRLPARSADFGAGWMFGLAGGQLTSDAIGWFPSDEERIATLAGTFSTAVGELRVALGDRPHQWRWGAMHHKALRHPLSAIGDLGALLDQPSKPAGGAMATLNNSGFAGGRVPAGDPRYATNWEGVSGAGYRLVADLGDSHGSAWTVTLEGQSAHPGSPNRSDQLDEFLAGHHHELSLDRDRAEASAAHRLIVEPRVRHD